MSLPPIDKLSSSSDGDPDGDNVEPAQPSAPPAKKQKVGQQPTEFRALFNQLCDCSKKRKRQRESCFRKLKADGCEHHVEWL